MDTFAERVARAILLAAGVSAVWVLLALPPAGGAALPLLLHHRFLIAVLAAALLGAVLVRTLRPAVVATGLLSQAGFVGIALAMPGFSATTAFYLNLAGMAALLCAGALLLHSARRQARWEGLTPRHGEA
ncbi:MAG: hypothetical protein PSV26_00490 [Polaromonas sp.]|uniref:hypothetical protein n=1 Tax=Polaromonas sp. TaxID=1869339 RepID=UPI0024892CE0|nr:hypothetical protein [Polaromonas sp.]MDI1235940.1 hypothetical protein [Polaromonas sp.]